MSTKNSRALDRQARGAASTAGGQEQQLNDANVASGPDARVAGTSRGWGDKGPKRVQRRPGK